MAKQLSFKPLGGRVLVEPIEQEALWLRAVERMPVIPCFLLSIPAPK